MTYTTSAGHLNDLISALHEPASNISGRAGARRILNQIADRGWAHLGTIEDALMAMDHRLKAYGAGDVKLLAKMLSLPWRVVADRPRRSSAEVALFSAMSATDVAQLLIQIEAMGFTVDPEPLVSRLKFAIETSPVLTDSELSILWHNKTRHRTAPLSIRPTSLSGAYPDTGRLKLGNNYRAQWWLDEAGNVALLTINAPKHRRRPDPVSVICPDCGAEYDRGNPDSTYAHRKEHRRRVKYMQPVPSIRLLQARNVDTDAAWVTSKSPAWKHNEMYERALAFKREFHYDFTQWGSHGRDDDPNARGFLFSNEAGAITGACAFRLRINDECSRWGLQWVWIAPQYRRDGYLTRQWKIFRSKFGDFTVEAPVSPAMAAFLAKEGDAHLIA